MPACFLSKSKDALYLEFWRASFVTEGLPFWAWPVTCAWKSTTSLAPHRTPNQCREQPRISSGLPLAAPLVRGQMAPPQTVQVLTCVPPRLGTRLRPLQAQRRVHVFVQATQIPDVNDVEHVLGADSLTLPPVVPVTAIFLRGKGYHLRHTTPNSHCNCGLKNAIDGVMCAPNSLIRIL